MSKEEVKPELYPKNGELTFLMPNTNAIGALKDASLGRKLTVKYKEAGEWLNEIDKPVRCYFLGFKEAADSKGNPYFIAKLHDGENAFVCAQTVLVQALMTTELGQGVEITCTGHSQTNGNKIPLFDVVELEDLNLTRGANE